MSFNFFSLQQALRSLLQKTPQKERNSLPAISKIQPAEKIEDYIIPEDKFILIISHPRSGTHLTIDSIRHNIEGVENNYINLERLLPDHKENMSIKYFIDTVNSLNGKIILKSHQPPSFEEFRGSKEILPFIHNIINKSQKIYVVRDGRDVLTSFYYFNQGFDPKIKKVPFSTYLLVKNHFIDLDRIDYWMYHINQWINQPNICVVRFEDFHHHYAQTLKKIASYLQLPLKKELTNMLNERRNLTLRSAVDFRKGDIGDWKELFSKSDTSLFETKTAEFQNILNKFINSH